MTIARTALPTDPKHLKLAFSFLGLREGPGPQDNPTVLAFYRDAGHPEVAHDDVAWCAAFAGAILARSGQPNSHSLAARSYLDWGKDATEPKRGDLVVFSRGGSTWQGHIAFWLGEEGGTVTVLGGNQSDSVSIATYPLMNILGIRTPITLSNSRTAKALGVTTAGAVVTGSVDQLQNAASSLTDAGGMIQTLSILSPWFMAAGVALSILGIGWAAYARYSDWKEKGR